MFGIFKNKKNEVPNYNPEDAIYSGIRLLRI